MISIELSSLMCLATSIIYITKAATEHSMIDAIVGLVYLAAIVA